MSPFRGSTVSGSGVVDFSGVKFVLFSYKGAAVFLCTDFNLTALL
jgi:hypothetical protein